jgi:hypothetical protein
MTLGRKEVLPGRAGLLVRPGGMGYRSGGRVLRKEGAPMAKFLVNVIAAVVAGVLVALIIRWINV